MKTSVFGLPSTVWGGDKVDIQNSTDQVTGHTLCRSQNEEGETGHEELGKVHGGGRGHRTSYKGSMWMDACMHAWPDGRKDKRGTAESNFL